MQNSSTETRYGERHENWRAGADCVAEDPEIFFVEGNTHTSRQVIREARTICRDCPVIKECLSEALRNKESYGIWGGLTTDERRVNKRLLSSSSFTKDALVRIVSERLAVR